MNAEQNWYSGHGFWTVIVIRMRRGCGSVERGLKSNQSLRKFSGHSLGTRHLPT